jgi:HD-GYP domain-containing protein (c-di-GMP phosphodiesterase class II)
MPEKNITENSPNNAPRLEEEIEAPDKGFAFVRISEFYSPRKVAFDLHLRLGENRYLRIFRAGENFEEAELKAYEAEKGMRYVYFLREHRSAYVTASLALMEKLTGIPAIPLKTKFGVARILSELYIQSVFDAEGDEREKLIGKGKEICAALAAWIDTQPGLEKFLFQLDQIDANVPSLSFLTGVFSSLLQNRLPSKSRRQIEFLLLANFLGDIGQTALPEDVRKLKPKRMNQAQKRQFEKHPEASYLLLSESESDVLNENVLSIVRQHHEYADGSGYPRSLTGDKTLMLAKIVVLCGDLIRTASELLLPPGDAAKTVFPEFTEKLLKEHPDLVAKYDKELLPPLFKMLKEGGF